MLIRSKSEVSLVNIETGLLTIQDGDTIVFHSNNWKFFILVRYCRIVKSLMVMVLIQEAYDICERCKITGDLWGFGTFRMPDDDEVKENV